MVVVVLLLAVAVLVVAVALVAAKARVMRIYEGSSEIQRNIIASQLLARHGS